MPNHVDFAHASAALARGATLVTANNRLARHLGGHYADLRTRGGQTAWETPDILPYGAWLERSFRLATEDDPAAPGMIGPQQARVLWEAEVNASPAGRGLLRPEAAARLAMEAWERLCGWDLGLDALGDWGTAETRAFAGWARGFLAVCAQHRWLDTPRLPATLASAVRAGAFAPPGQLLLAGFDEFPPAMRRVLDALDDTGCTVQQLSPQRRAGRACRVAFPDRMAELRAAASWAATRLNTEPGARLGIVVPDLAERRALVTRIFDGLLNPASMFPAGRNAAPAYNLSLGRPLGDFPLVRDALLSLRLALGSIGFDGLSTLLRSPFLGDGEREYVARSTLEASLRQRPDRQFFIHAVHALCEGCPRLARRLESAGRRLARSDTPAGWARRFRDILASLGWPGERTLDSHEYQQVERFRRLVDDFTLFGDVENRMDAGRALGCLERQARDLTFQPEHGGAAIHVTGLLEAAGQSFDGLWITGLSDQQWPPTAQPNPLLPVALQRRHGLPHASPERELAFASRLTERLCQGADEVIASWPEREDDRELLPSPLITTLPAATPAALDYRPLLPPPESWLGRMSLATLEDTQGTPLAPGAHPGGGSRLLRDQAVCPFRGYACHRLHAEGLADPVAGASPFDRGNLLHACLEAFWRAVGSHHRLLTLDAPALESRIAAAIEEGMAAAGRAGEPLGERHRRLEVGRLERLLARWLEAERRRAPFTVTETERRRDVRMGSLSLTTLADRVDRLEDGRLVVIDYKSGMVQRAGWFEGRLFEPQLPLYALTAGVEPVAAVAFAQLKAGDSRFVGTAEDDGLLPQVTAVARDRQRKQVADWPRLLDRWKTELESLATEVLAGFAPVAPQQSGICRFCDLGDLCRVPWAEDNGTEDNRNG